MERKARHEVIRSANRIFRDSDAAEVASRQAGDAANVAVELGSDDPKQRIGLLGVTERIIHPFHHGNVVRLRLIQPDDPESSLADHDKIPTTVGMWRATGDDRRRANGV
jgi:hypothetical protein